jgi:replication factor C subunit 1
MAYGNTGFTSWLGNNSKQGKLTRMVKEIQSHMRLRTAADRHEVRQLYVPMFWDKMPKRMAQEGKDVLPEVIDLMDSYFLTRDDFDAVCELRIGDEAKIDPPTKAAFTRT